jgi:uncharacterized protein (TIGR00661 family)
MKPSQQIPKPYIVYGIQGEGRGHATRALQVIRGLEKKGYRVHIYTGGDAAHLLKQKGYSVRNIPLLRYHYAKNGTISCTKTFFHNFTTTFKMLTGIGRVYKTISREIQDLNPFLILSDFEMYSSRIANTLGIPLYSVHHQHLFTESQLPKLQNISDSVRVFTCALSTKMITGRPDKIFSSSFFHFPKKTRSKAFFIGPFLETSWQERTFSDRGHITIYMKKSCYLEYWNSVFSAFPHLSFHVFSDFKENDEHIESFPHVQYHKISRDTFLESFAHCRALIATAGNQVMGEAIYAQKPLLVVPEPNAVEQKLNAIGLAQSGLGMTIDFQKISPNVFQQFLNKHVENPNISNVLVSLDRYDGTQVVIQHIDLLYQKTISSWIAPTSDELRNRLKNTSKHPVLSYKAKTV